MMLILGRLAIYRNKIEEMAALYVRHFGSEVVTIEADRVVDLRPEGAGAVLMLHPASVKQKEGQVLVKLVFDMEDVQAFGAPAKVRGLVFG